MSVVSPQKRPVDAWGPSNHSMVGAWVAVMLIPVFAFLSFAAGVATLSAFGYSSSGDEPLWVDLVVALVSIAVLFVHCAGAVFFGRRARRAGARGAAVPIAIGAVVGAAALLLAVVTEIGNALR